jgi:hypothetical protein
MDNIKLWMPVTKSMDGRFHAILSDTSIDRDEEMIGAECIKDWAKNKSLPALINHENKMEKLIGGWEEINYLENGEHTALVANPWFFPVEVCPFADEMRKKIEYSSEKGLNVGISIQAIPTDHIMKKIGDKTYKVWTKAELVEATWVPIQSNRNATYIKMAKSFEINKEEKMAIKKENPLEELHEEGTPEQKNIEKPKEVEDCVRALMDDPDFEPLEGRTKEESAWAVCQEKFKEKCPCQDKLKTKSLDVKTVNLQKEIDELKKELQSLRLAKKESDDKLNAITKAPSQDQAFKEDDLLRMKDKMAKEAFEKAYYGELRK